VLPPRPKKFPQDFAFPVVSDFDSRAPAFVTRGTFMHGVILNKTRNGRLRGAFLAGSILSVPALGHMAIAGDLTVSAARTTPVVTSNADGAGRGNVTVTSAGSVAATTGAAVTLDSSNSVTNAGTISNSGETFAIGARVTTAAGDLTGGLTNSGTISVPGPSATSANTGLTVTNSGIQVDGANIFHGSITQNAGSTLTVGGNGSTGILVNGRIDGSVINNGTITMGGNAAWGISTAAAITGGITNGGTISGAGQATIGIYAGGGVGGAITNTGSISTGTVAGTNVATNPLLPGGRALWVAGNAGGILLEGNGVTAAQGGTGNGLTDSTLTVIGGGEALYVGPGGAAGYQNITVGALASDPNGSSLLIRGNITSSALSAVSSVRAVNITGVTQGGVNYRTTFTGALTNSGGEITASGIDTPVNAVRIGELTTIPSFINSGAILALAKDSSESATTGAAGFGGGDATAITIDARGNLAAFTNSGVITAESHGATQNAYGVQDNSGTLTSVTNSGSVTATVKGTGAALAFDLSHATSAVTFNNSGSIIGDIALGSGNNSFTSTNGGLSGAITAGAGNNTIALGNTLMTGAFTLGAGSNSISLTNSTLTGGIGANGGTVALNMSGSTLVIPATSTVHITNGSITGASTVTFNINATAGLYGTIKADGALAVGSGTTLTTNLVGPVSSSLTVNLIEAQVLSLGTNISVQQPSSSLMYTKRIALAADNANILQYQVTRNTATQLGLSSDLGKVYEASISALATDNDLAAVLGGMTDRTAFTKALGQLLPDTTDAMRTAALQGQNLAQSAIRRRMDGVLRDRDEPLGRYRSSYWAQTFGTYGTQSAQNGFPGYRVITGGLAAGVDGELGPDALGGISLSQSESYLNQKDVDRTGHLSTTAIDLYTRVNADPGYVQAIVGFGYNGHSSKRSIAIDTIERTAESDWTGNQFSTTIDAGTTLGAGNVLFTPYLRGAYARIFEQAHKETGAGDGVDLTYGHQTSTSLRAGGGVLAQYQIQLSDLSTIELEGRGDYAHEFKTDAPLISARFNAGTTTFTVLGPAGASAIISGGAGISWKQKFSSWSLDYDAEKAGGYLGHTGTLTYRIRF
jgi:uncharacterized protein with beta-barrel porin domain